MHRLSDLGAVVTYAAHGVSHQGFDAEWQGVNVVTVDGEMVNRIEFFDEADLDAAIARFDQLSQPAPRLENAASRAYSSAYGRTSRPGTGMPWPSSWPTTIRSTITEGS